MRVIEKPDYSAVGGGPNSQINEVSDKASNKQSARQGDPKYKPGKFINNPGSTREGTFTKSSQYSQEQKRNGSKSGGVAIRKSNISSTDAAQPGSAADEEVYVKVQLHDMPVEQQKEQQQQ